MSRVILIMVRRRVFGNSQMSLVTLAFSEYSGGSSREKIVCSDTCEIILSESTELWYY